MLIALVTAFIGGMILNVMPCVFPVLSLKAMGLARHGGHPAQLRLEGLAYLGGVVATMLLLAGTLIAARASGAAVGWGFQLQSPLVTAALALILLGAGLNLAGLFEIGLAAQRMGAGVGQRGGAIGSALTGALAIVVATPCTGPFMAGAIGYALVQPPLVALAVFLALALGFAAPFTALSFIPALAARLPKPGAWLPIVKRAFAFPMFGAAAWLVWVLDRQAGASALALVLGCGVALAVVAWIYGMAQQQRMTGQRSSLLYGLSGTGFLAIVAALPASGVTAAAPPAASIAVAAAMPDAPIAWSPEKLAALRGRGQPVFVNFTAAWCITCQVNDKAALATAPVKQALSRTGTIYMIADSTKYDARIDKALAEFGREGLPLYVVYPADGGAPAILPQLLSPGIVAAALDRAARKHA